MKQKINYYCKGCGTEIRIFGIMGKDTSVGCKNCKIPMYEVIIKKKHTRGSLNG